MSRKIVCTQRSCTPCLKIQKFPEIQHDAPIGLYTPEFKAQLVAMCQQPGASIAALAGQHAMNANVLHRWLKEQEVKIELRKSALSIVVNRPLSAGSDLAGWTAAILK